MFSSKSSSILSSLLRLLLPLIVLVATATSGGCQLLRAQIIIPAAERTRTATFQVVRSGSLVITSSDLAALRLSKAGIFPQAFITLEIINSTFTTFTSDCQNALTIDNYASLITGKDWLTSELLPTAPAPVITQPSEDSNKATISFKSSALFDSRASLSEEIEYVVRLPSLCTNQQVSSPVSFKLTATPTSQLAGILAFSILLAGTVGFLAVVSGGSLYAYLPVQLAVMITSCGCGPIDAQAESYTVGFTMSPLPYTNRDRMPHYQMLLTNLLIFMVLTVLEVIHFAIRWMRLPQYSARLIASLKGKREAFLSNYKPTEDDKYVVPPEDVPKRPMPFYLLFAMFATLGTGTFYHSVRVLSFEARDIKHYGAGAVGIIVWFLFFAFSLSLSLTKGAFYKPYATSKKKLPRVMTPDGCVGPNVFRLSFGCVVNDMRQGRRAFSTFPIIYSAIIAILVGSTQPSSSSCRTTLSLSWLVTFLFGVFVYRSRPLRSTIANLFAVAYLVAALVALSAQLMYGGYDAALTDRDHWSGRMAVIALFVLALLSIFNSLSTLIVAFWEFGEAHRTGKYSDGRSGGGMLLSPGGDDGDIGGGGDDMTAASVGATGAEQFERHVAFLVGEMKTIIQDGGGQPLEPDDHFVAGSSSTRSGKKGGGGTSSHLQAPTLSQFLLQDFEALPADTQDRIVASERIAKQAEMRYGVKNNSGAASPNNRLKKNEYRHL